MQWIHDFKYPGRGLAGCDPRARAVVSELVIRVGLESYGQPPELVVPIPLHPRRLRERGFNPAALLAHNLSRAWGVPWNPVALRRLRDTPSQTRLDRDARQANVRDAFQARGKQPAHVCVLDDVVTTGATLEAAARALHAAGSTRVTAVCAARTLAPRTGQRA
ncbi:MAG: phosphoribosyltransferase family protein [Myxococcota bacterium]